MRRASRRWFLAAATSSGTLAVAARGRRLSAPRVEFADGLTGREVRRLTDLQVLHHLPEQHHRFLARDNSFLLVIAEHGGSRQIHRLDLRRQLLTQLTEGEGVHPYTAHLQARGRGLFFLQGNDLLQTDLNGRRRRLLYSCPDDWMLTGDSAFSVADRYAALVEMRRDHWEPDPGRQFERQPLCRLRIVELDRQGSRPRNWIATEERRWLGAPRFRPWHSQVLYTRLGPWTRVQRRLQLVGLDGTGRTSLRPTAGREFVGRASWFRDGSMLRFVHFPDANRWRAAIRSLQPESGTETTEAPCSGFGWFQANADGSAIVGASRRPSGPNLYLLFPRMQREITLCEHASSRQPYPVAGTDRLDPRASVPEPCLSPDSSRVYFVTDREGMPAVYSTSLDDLVEPTPAR